MFGWRMKRSEDEDKGGYGKTFARSRSMDGNRSKKLEERYPKVSEKKISLSQPFARKPEHFVQQSSFSQGSEQKWKEKSKKFWFIAYKEQKAKLLKMKRVVEKYENKFENMRVTLNNLLEIIN